MTLPVPLGLFNEELGVKVGKDDIGSELRHTVVEAAPAEPV